MVVYNITLRIEPEIEAEWLQWQRQEHIPEVLATGKFTGYRFFRLLDRPAEEGLTFVVQYFADSMSAYEDYIRNYAPGLRQKAFDKWGEQFVAFRTVMEEVS
ncbi:MAG TPA: DUF4286 family protein [Chitinophagaceae bacterium]|nr:DUF4286 family protein [Chitinophagaceae bacterium]